MSYASPAAVIALVPECELPTGRASRSRPHGLRQTCASRRDNMVLAVTSHTTSASGISLLACLLACAADELLSQTGS